MYASKNSIDTVHKNQVPKIKFLDYQFVQYFTTITNAIKLSSRYEVFKFLSLNYSDIGQGVINPNPTKRDLDGFILPENFSNFPKGYKVITFYISPEELLSKSYVLRKDGWRAEMGLYQRMLNTRKVNDIRNYLYSQQRVFINNLIVTLPSDTKILNADKNTVDPAVLRRTVPILIQLSENFDTIGIIDGQHRVYAYHEGGSYEEEIKKLREKQNLLVTGIIYPPHITEKEKTQFEAALFLEINSNQSAAKNNLKQAIELLIKPFTKISISKAIIHRMNVNGPLEGLFEEFHYDSDKIKTSTIVSFALVPIVKLSGNDSLFSLWSDPDKENLKNENYDSLYNYIAFCASSINYFLGSVRKNIDINRWTANKSVPDRVLSVVSINAFIICLRLLIENNPHYRIEDVDEQLKGINNFDFNKYKSSQYSRMGRDIYDSFFK